SCGSAWQHRITRRSRVRGGGALPQSGSAARRAAEEYGRHPASLVVLGARPVLGGVFVVAVGTCERGGLADEPLIEAATLRVPTLASRRMEGSSGDIPEFPSRHRCDLV